MNKLVVIGNGMAGARVVEEILKRAPDRFDIVMFGAEPVRQLQPNPAEQRAQRHAGGAGHLHESAVVVSRERHHAARRRARHADRSRAPSRCRHAAQEGAVAYAADAAERRGRDDRRGALRPRHHRHRLAAIRAADGGLRRTGNISLPHDRRLRAHRRLREGAAAARRSSAAACSASKPRADC